MLDDRGASLVRRSVDAAGWNDPLAPLARDPSDQVEVSVVVQDHESSPFSRGGDQEVRNFSASQSAGREQPLDLASPFHVESVGFDERECGERRRQLCPLAQVSRREAYL